MLCEVSQAFAKSELLPGSTGGGAGLFRGQPGSRKRPSMSTPRAAPRLGPWGAAATAVRPAGWLSPPAHLRCSRPPQPRPALRRPFSCPWEGLSAGLGGCTPGRLEVRPRLSLGWRGFWPRFPPSKNAGAVVLQGDACLGHEADRPERPSLLRTRRHRWLYRLPRAAHCALLDGLPRRPALTIFLPATFRPRRGSEPRPTMHFYGSFQT